MQTMQYEWFELILKKKNAAFAFLPYAKASRAFPPSSIYHLPPYCRESSRRPKKEKAKAEKWSIQKTSQFAPKDVVMPKDDVERAVTDVVDAKDSIPFCQRHWRAGETS